MRRPGIRIGKPLDFTAYAGAGNDRDVLRWVTDEIMNAVMELSGQTYVDAYGSSVKEALEEGRAARRGWSPPGRRASAVPCRPLPPRSSGGSAADPPADEPT